MATKTVILRPYDTTIPSNQDYVTLYPSDTAAENANLLINEAEADDDSTYVILHNSLIGTKHDFKKPSDLTIIGVKTHCRAKSSGTSNAVALAMSVIPAEGSELDEAVGTAKSAEPGTSEWENYSADYSDDSTIMEALNNSEYTKISIKCYSGSSPGSGNKTTSVPTSITQVYLELTYEEPETTTTPIYLRENGTWNAVSGTIYRKENGVWVESDDTVFTQGDQFALNVFN